MALTNLNCSYNQLTKSALNDLFNTLPTATMVDSWDGIYIGGNPGASACNRSIAIGKGWVFKE
jgi:hypothetical protein